MKLFLTFILFICPFFSYANDVGYEVEVILFEDLSNKYSNSEEWLISDDIQTPETQTRKTDSNNSTSAEHPDPVFQKLTIENSRLGTQLEKLQKHSNYRILAHKIWKQTGLDAEKAFPIVIDSESTIKAASATDSIATTESLENSSSLSGTVTLIMSRYLHINANLVYHKPLLLDEEGSNQTQTGNLYKNYQVTFERRMRSKEIHYIDHPFVGMIILAVPFKLETQPVNEAESTSET